MGMMDPNLERESINQGGGSENHAILQQNDENAHPNPAKPISWERMKSAWRNLWAKFHHVIEEPNFEMIPQPGLQTYSPKWQTWLEIFIIIAWAIYAGRGYLNFSPDIWLYGSDYPLQVLNYYVWRLLPTCGGCVFWNGWVSGGWPAFGDWFGGILHPLVIISTLIFGAINASKIVVVASMAMAGLGQWWLARVMRLGTLPRMWIAMIAVAGGQLSGRMDMGLIIMYLSIAATSLIIAPAVDFALTGRRKTAIWMGILLAFAIMSGHGYMQLGLILGVAPAYLILLWGDKIRQPIFKLRLLLAGGLAILVSSVNWLPLIRFWNNIVKAGDPAFFGTQSIPYIPLNMLISDYAFYTTEALQKKPFPAHYMIFIGWIPVILALLTIFLVPRKARRIWAFFAIGIFAIYLISSGFLLHMLVGDLKFLAGARHPAIISTLSIPFVLGLAAWGLELLLNKLKWPGLNLKKLRNGPYIYQLPWAVLIIGLLFSIFQVYQFSRRWKAVEIPADRLQAVERVKEELDHTSTQWVGYPFGDLPFAALAVEAGLKVNIDEAHRNASWKDRSLPPPYIEAIKENLSSEAPDFLAQIANYASLLLHPENQYASIIIGEDKYACEAEARGGDIEVTCDSPAAGKLIVYENMYDGWKARLDGEPARLIGDEWLSVDAPAGEHTYTFRYRPWDAILGSILAIISLFLAVVLLVIPDRRHLPDGREVFITDVSQKSLPADEHSQPAPQEPSSSAANLDQVKIHETGTVITESSQMPTGGPVIIHPEPKLQKPEEAEKDDVGINQEKTTHVDVDIDALRMHVGLDLPPGARVSFSITSADDGSKHSFTVDNPGEHIRRDKPKHEFRPVLDNKLQNGWKRFIRIISPYSLGFWLFVAGLVVYLLVHLIDLAKFPIYFFTDEAIQTMSAVDLIKNGFHGPEGALLPTFFKNGPYYNLGLSVYLQIIPSLLFGKSVFVTRAVSVLFTLIAAISISLSLRDFYEVKYWWAGVFVLSFTPSWFLHSRTAFETVIFASCYAGFLFSYLMYRCRSPRYIYLALVMAALAFYSYSPGQLVIATTGVAFLFIDLRYHWKNRTMYRKVLLTLALILLPYLRFRLENNFSPTEHLQLLNSYWVQPITLGEKISRFWVEYSRGLSINYWFIPGNNDLERHMMKGYGNLPIFTLPFFIGGLILSVWNIRKPQYRVLLVSFLAAPLGSALVGIGITRVLVFVIPAILLIMLGIGYCLNWFENVLQTKINKRTNLQSGKNTITTLISMGLFFLLTLANVLLVRDALINGPQWFSNYGLGGMQYGGSQLFPAVAEFQNNYPDKKIIVSPNWANGTDVLARFFSTKDNQFELGSIEGYLFKQQPLDENTVFVMIPDEYNKVIDSGKFKDIKVEKILPYPDGQPGFYFARLQYVDDIEELFTSEAEARTALQEGEVVIDGEVVQVKYSLLDMGSIELIFDGQKQSVARTLEANPFIIELTFPEARTFTGYRMFLGSADIRVTFFLFPPDNGEPYQSVSDFDGSPSNPELEVNFGKAMLAQKIRFEVLQPYSGVPSNVHVWEIGFLY
jgi:hypothetical protein